MNKRSHEHLLAQEEEMEQIKLLDASELEKIREKESLRKQ